MPRAKGGAVSHAPRAVCGVEMLDAWGDQVPHGWVTGDDEVGRHSRFRHELRERGECYVLGLPCDTPIRAYSTDSCHPIHGKVATQSTGSLPPSPRETCHSVHGKVATHSRRSLPPSERSDAGWHILSLNWLFLSTGPAVCAWILLVMEFYTRCGPDDRGWHRRASDLQEPHASARRGVGS